jgi:hypothetical protein
MHCKIRRQSLGREPGDAVGLGGLGGRVVVRAGNEVDEDGVGGGEHGARVEGLGRAEQGVVSGVVLSDGAGGAGDVLHVEPEDVNLHGGAALLPGLGLAQSVIIGFEVG